MAGAIDHLMINANSYEKAIKFYSWLIPKIGYPKSETYKQPPMTGFFSNKGSLWLVHSNPEFLGDSFNKGRIGLREIAFRADSRAEVDAIAKEVESNGGKILDAPKEYDYAPGYYAVFFTDPDGLKLEVVTYSK